jgi:acyl carrier protein
MWRMSVDQRLEQLLREFFNDDELVLADGLAAGDVPGWDSLANVNLMFSIEQEFGITFDDSEFGQFSNLGELRQSIERRLAHTTRHP